MGALAQTGIERLTLAFVLLIFLIPFVLPIHRLPQTLFDGEWTAAILLCGAALALGLLRKQQVPINLPLPLWLVSMVGVVAIQYSLGKLAYRSQFSLCCVYAFALLGAYWIGRALLAYRLRDAAVATTAWALVIGAIFSVAIQWLQLFNVQGLPVWLYFEIEDPWFRTRPFANIGQANHLATYLVWGLFATLYLHRRSLRLPATLACAFVIALGLALTRSRMGALFMLAPLAACWLPWAMRPATLRERAGVTLAVLLGYVAGSSAVSMLVAFNGIAVDTALARFGETGGFSIRWGMWADAVRVAATAPWLGTGFGQFPLSQYLLARPGGHEISTNNVHNLVLQTAAELGWPLALGLCGLLLWWVIAQFKQRMNVRETAFAWALVVAILVHALLEWPLASLYFSIPAVLIFALAEPEGGARLGATVLKSRLLLVVAAAGLVLGATMKLEFDEISGVMYRADAERKTTKGLDEDTLRQMLALSSTSMLRVYPELLLASLRKPGAVEATEEEIELHQRVLVRSADPLIVARLVILNAQAGRIDESLRHAERLWIFNKDDYALLGKMILKAIEPLGATADPVRREVAARLQEAPEPAARK
jgi:hypothetical protein